MKLFTGILAILSVTHCSAQKIRKVSAYLSFNVNSTQYDRTITNNAVGFGGGLQLYLRTNTWVCPALDATADVFGGTKELYLTQDNKPIFAKDAVSTLFAGGRFQPSNRFFAMFTAGAAFLNNHTYAGIKPAIGYHLLKGRQLTARVCFTNIFQHDEISNQSFGYWNFCLAVKLF